MLLEPHAMMMGKKTRTAKAASENKKIFNWEFQ